MENDSPWDKFSDALNEQEWFSTIKSKWEELDPQSRIYLKLGGAVATVLLVSIFAASFVWNVHKLKGELAEKNELLNLISNANDELRRLKESNSQLGAASAANDPWGAYFSNLAAPSGIPREGVTVSEEKKGAANDQTKESLFDISIKHVSIRQIVRYVVSLENSARPVKLRNLLLDTKDDSSGYIDATLSVSGFSLVQGK